MRMPFVISCDGKSAIFGARDVYAGWKSKLQPFALTKIILETNISAMLSYLHNFGDVTDEGLAEVKTCPPCWKVCYIQEFYRAAPPRGNVVGQAVRWWKPNVEDCSGLLKAVIRYGEEAKAFRIAVTLPGLWRDTKRGCSIGRNSEQFEMVREDSQLWESTIVGLINEVMERSEVFEEPCDSVDERVQRGWFGYRAFDLKALQPFQDNVQVDHTIP